MTDSVVDHFYWLSVDEPASGKFIDAKIADNQITVQTEGVNSLTIHLDRRLIDPGKPVKILMGDKTTVVDYQPDLGTLCRSVAELSDLELAYDFEVTIETAAKSQ
jgi:hypothetical protein